MMDTLSSTPAPGKVREITSAANPLVRQLRSLSLKKYREKSGLFMVEGLKLVLEGLGQGFEIDTLIFAKSASDHGLVGKAATRTIARGGLVVKTTRTIMATLTRRDNPQTVVGVFRQRWRDLADMCLGEKEVYVALDRIRDPGNLGTIIRSCDAVGARGIILIGETCDPYSLEAVRATMGSIFVVELLRASEAQFLHWRPHFDAQLIGTHLKGSVDYRHVDYQKGATLLLMGNEQQGLSDALSASCRTLVRIPQWGQADSLNLAVATAIMLYEIRRHEEAVGTSQSHKEAVSTALAQAEPERSQSQGN